jgi:hypothetical protein
MWRHQLLMSYLTHSNSFWRLARRRMHLLAKVCHGRFRNILPKEYSGTFPELRRGLLKEIHTNIRGLSDIVTPPTNILNKVYPVKRVYSLQCLLWIWSHSKLLLSMNNSSTREALLKRKYQYGWPPCTYLFRSAAFQTETKFSFFTKQPILMRRSTVLSLPLQ